MDDQELDRLLQSSFQRGGAISLENLTDRNAGQDTDDVKFFLDRRVHDAWPHELLLHGSYALPYFSLIALRVFLPLLLSTAMKEGFQYQPVLDSVVTGVLDFEWNWGRHLQSLHEEERGAIQAWLNHLKESDRYDPYLIAEASRRVSEP